MATVKKRTWRTSKGERRTGFQLDYVDQSGERVRKLYKTKSEADAERIRIEGEVVAGTHVPDNSSITVKEAGRRWLETGVNEGLEATTIDQRKQHLTYHIEPLLGRTKLSKLTVAVVRDFQDRLRSTPYPDDFPVLRLRGAQRSAAMVSRVMVSLGSLLADAQERGLSGRNAVREMRRTRRGKDAKRHKARLAVGVDIPTVEEIRSIIAAATGRYRPLLITAVFTGMRASELRGLRWSDVDLERRELHVRQRADRDHVIGMPKTEASQRTIPLPPLAVNTLREWKLQCPKGSLDLVFPNGEGNVEWHANIVKRGLLPTQIAAGVTVPIERDESAPSSADDAEAVRAKYSGMHALRHFYASWCINRREDGGLGLLPKAVQERMGHSSITMTMDVYGHLFPRGDEQEELASAEASLLRNVEGGLQ